MWGAHICLKLGRSTTSSDLVARVKPRPKYISRAHLLLLSVTLAAEMGRRFRKHSSQVRKDAQTAFSSFIGMRRPSNISSEIRSELTECNNYPAAHHPICWGSDETGWICSWTVTLRTASWWRKQSLSLWIRGRNSLNLHENVLGDRRIIDEHKQKAEGKEVVILSQSTSDTSRSHVKELPLSITAIQWLCENHCANGSGGYGDGCVTLELLVREL